MHFHLEQPVAAPAPQVVVAFADPERFAAGHQGPEVGAPEVLDRREEADGVRLRLRYRYIGSVSPAARRVVDPEKLSWVQELTVVASELRAEFRMVPDHYPDRLRCQGAFRFEPAGADATRQVMEGDLRVSVPLVGAVLEHGLLAGVRRYLAAEAPALAELARRD